MMEAIFENYKLFEYGCIASVILVSFLGQDSVKDLKPTVIIMRATIIALCVVQAIKTMYGGTWDFNVIIAVYFYLKFYIEWVKNKALKESIRELKRVEKDQAKEYLKKMLEE